MTTAVPDTAVATALAEATDVELLFEVARRTLSGDQMTELAGLLQGESR